METQSHWLWYPGDLERYHALKQNFSRVERGFGWPAYWKSEGYRQRVVFRRDCRLEAEERFTVFAVKGAVGYVLLDGDKFPLGSEIRCPAGEHSLAVHVGCIACMPAIFVRGETICSDDGWTVGDFDAPPVPAAWNKTFTDPRRDPSEWPLAERAYAPVTVEELDGGVLYGFETELTAALEILGPGLPRVCLGESRTEALDTERCYLSCVPDPETRRCPRHALRYAYIPGCGRGDYAVRAIHQYVDIPVLARFCSGDEELDRIFSVAAHTFSLCSGVFILDGAKRDKWIWAGDAYQSLLVNRYLTADRELEKRTLLALSPGEPVRTHVNTILDYSLLWICSVETWYESYGDRSFVRELWPRMKSLMALCLSQRDEHGFILGREQDWVFIDWADFDRDGPLGAEQLLLAEALRVMAHLAPDEGDRFAYETERAALLEQIERFYWDAEQGAYIDSFRSGRRHVTRHANILAILFDVADGERREQIARRVLMNEAVDPITTPYFRFFELEALCRLGHLDAVLEEIRRYWGGMLRLGAVSFWEEYDPDKPPEAQYEMYGDPYGKSLCHAWAASPIYLLARYFVGLRPLSPGGTDYEIRPQSRFLPDLDCAFPMGGRLLRIRLAGGELTVEEKELR